MEKMIQAQTWLELNSIHLHGNLLFKVAMERITQVGQNKSQVPSAEDWR